MKLFTRTNWRLAQPGKVDQEQKPEQGRAAITALLIGKIGKASPHAAYISRIGKYADRLEHGELLETTATGNMPAWAQHDPLLFWQAADQHERSNGSTYREHEMALPRELSPSQRKVLVEDWIKQGISY